MTAFTPDQIEAVISTCRENIAAVAESLNQCFDTKNRLELGKESSWSPEADSAGFAGPGLVVTIGVGDEALAVLIPASLPLPGWYTKPGDSENARLQTLPMEWSMNILPADMEAGRAASVDVADLWQALKDSAPSDTARMAELLVFPAEGNSGAGASSSPAAPAATASGATSDTKSEATPEKTSETLAADATAGEKSEATPADAGTVASSAGPAPIARLLMVWPVTKPMFEKPAGAKTSDNAASAKGENSSAAGAGTPGPPGPVNEFRKRAQRVFQLPVIVSVRLAEKRIEMGQLLSITPGSLITFNKSCEELLDLYVNNRKYCRGEAVKIGEKFGIKINAVGVVDVREERVL